jgi:hypothetical protein
MKHLLIHFFISSYCQVVLSPLGIYFPSRRGPFADSRPELFAEGLQKSRFKIGSTCRANG